MKSQIGLADLARIIARLAPDDARDLAGILGLEQFAGSSAPSIDGGLQSTVREPSQPANIGITSETRPRAGSGPREPMTFWRVEREEVAPEPQVEDESALETISDPRAEHERNGTLSFLPPTPLTPWRHLWPVLQDALRTELPGREPDTAALVARWSRGESVQRIPQVRRRAWAARASLWLDRSVQLAPVRADQERVLAGLHPVFRRNLDVRRLGAATMAAAQATPRGLLAARRPDPTAPMIVLGDLGRLTGIAAGLWTAALGGLVRQGVRVTALVPWSVRRNPKRALSGARMVSWERGRRAGDVATDEVRYAGGGDAVTRLLRLASVAMFVEPGLLRALRHLLPDADVETEVRAWSHPWTDDPDETGLLLRRDAMHRLRAEMSMVGDEPASRIREEVREIVRRRHEGLRCELTYAEALAWRSVAGPSMSSADDRTDAFMERLAAMMWRETAHDRAAWMHFGQVMLRGLDDASYARLPALVKLWAAVFRDVPEELLPRTIRPSDLTHPTRRPPLSWWALHQRGDRLVASRRPGPAWPSDRRDASPVAVLSAHETVVWVVRGAETRRIRHDLRDGAEIVLRPRERLDLGTDRTDISLGTCERPSWARRAGRDRWGLWASLFVGEVEARFRWIPPGTFVMGSPETEAGRFDSEVQHEVTLTHGYWLGETPVTQAMWEAVLGDGSHRSEFRSASRPVENVSWKRCQEFIARLGEIVPTLAGRLPTEAEWEHACRAGTTTATWVGDLTLRGECDAPELGAIAWYTGNSGVGFELAKGWDSSGWPGKQYPHAQAGTHIVGTRQANPWGLYDMLGNVYEWCMDWYGPYVRGTSADPAGALQGADRVLRGGSWCASARDVRAARRFASGPGYSLAYLGFRLAGGQGSALQHEPAAPRSGVAADGAGRATRDASERDATPPAPSSIPRAQMVPPAQNKRR